MAKHCILTLSISPYSRKYIGVFYQISSNPISKTKSVSKEKKRE